MECLVCLIFEKKRYLDLFYKKQPKNYKNCFFAKGKKILVYDCDYVEADFINSAENCKKIYIDLS